MSELTERRRMPPGHERGAALLVALILLLALTLIGLQGIRSTAMQERMSGNHQAAQRAFEAAESGLALAWREILTRADLDSFELDDATVGHDEVEVEVEFITWTTPPIGSGYDAELFRAAVYQAESVGTTGGDVTRTHIAGYYRLGPKP